MSEQPKQAANEGSVRASKRPTKPPTEPLPTAALPQPLNPPDADIRYRKGKQFVAPDEEHTDLPQRITNLLLSENLLVLAGLGTSLCIHDEAGHPRAPTMQKLWDAVTANVGNLEEIKRTVNYQTTNGKDDIEALLSRCQLFTTLRQDDAIIQFVKAADERIHTACSFVKQAESLHTHEAFLLRVARRSIRQPRMRLFTTNYDLCFEIAAANVGFVLVDGFTHTSPQRFDGASFSYDFVRRDQENDAPNYIPNVFHLYKLHGSIDWNRTDDGIITRDAAPSHPMMIYPRVAKFELSYRQPYFEMMSRFQAALRLPNTGLLILGYGFNDAHINEPLLAGLRSNVGLKCLVLDPAIEDSPTACHRQIIELIDQGDTRLTAIAGRFEAFVPLMPDLVASTEQELHAARLRVLTRP